MPDFNIRSDSVNVEQIMEQIRARIREKRGADYTEEQIRELAAVRLEKLLDPRGVRSDLLEQFRRTPPPAERPNYKFEEETLYETHRGPIRWIRRALQPLLKLFFNPNPLIQALHIQSRLNTLNGEREAQRYAIDQLNYEVIHNLVVEITRLGIEVKNLKMRLESMSGRLEFNERRARALESVVVYKPANERQSAHEAQAAPQPQQPPRAAAAPPATPGPQLQPALSGSQTPASAGGGPGGAAGEGPGQRSRRRRRRRGRRGGGSAVSVMGGAGGQQPAPQSPQQPHGEGAPPQTSNAEAARDASGAHDRTAETIERALVPEALPAEPNTSTGSEPDGGSFSGGSSDQQ